MALLAAGALVEGVFVGGVSIGGGGLGLLAADYAVKVGGSGIVQAGEGQVANSKADDGPADD